MTDEKNVEQPAPEQSQDNVPAPAGRGAPRRHRAAACSACRAPATPAATAAWSADRLPRAAPASLRWLARRGGRRPRGAAATDGLDHAVESVVIHRGEITFHVRREDLVGRGADAARRPALRFELCSGVSGVHYPDDTGRELHAVYHLLSMTHNRRIRLEVTVPDADPHMPSHRRRLPDERLARARDLRHVRDRLRRPPRADPDPHARRLAGPPAAQGLPAGRHPRRVQGRHDPAAGPAEELH